MAHLKKPSSPKLKLVCSFFCSHSSILSLRFCQKALLGYFFTTLFSYLLNPDSAAPGFEPVPVEMHQTGTLEGCSTD